MRESSAARHLLLPETKPQMAKADLRKADIDEQWRLEVGKAIDLVRTKHRLSLKEFSNAIERDERQVKRWIDGKEHAQVAAVLAVAIFRQAMVLALAEIAGEGIEIETVVRLRMRQSA